MHDFVIPLYVKVLAWICAAIIVTLNARLVYQQIIDWLHVSENPLMIWFTAIPVTLAAAILLLYIIFQPLLGKRKTEHVRLPHAEAHQLKGLEIKPYKRIAVAIDFSVMDKETISNAISQGGKFSAYLLIHIVESAGALMMGSDISDFETGSDYKNLEFYLMELKSKGFNCELKIGYGNPKKAIPEIVNEYKADLLVMGAHGHRGFKDLIFGTTVDSVRHRVKIPVLIVR